MTTPSSRRTYAWTCVFVNFAIVGRVDLIVQISGFSFHVPQEVVDEVTVAAQRQLLDQVLASGDLKKTKYTRFLSWRALRSTRRGLEEVRVRVSQ